MKSLASSSLFLLPKCKKIASSRRQIANSFLSSIATSHQFSTNSTQFSSTRRNPIYSNENALSTVLSEMNRFASRGRVDRVLKMWSVMQKILKREPLDTNQHPELRQIAQDIDAQTIESRIVYFYVYLLKAFVNAHDVQAAEEAMQKYFVTSFSRLAQPKHLISDLNLQQIRVNEGILPVTPTNPSVYTLMMKLYAQKLNSAAAAKVYESLEKDLPEMAAMDCLANNTLLSAYVDSNQYNSAKLFFTLKYRSPVNPSSESNTVYPDMATYAIMMKLSAALNEDEQINKIFEILTTDKQFQDARSRNDPYKYNIMLSHISKTKTTDELLEFFQKYFKSSLNVHTLKNKVIPTIHTYNTMFKCFSEKKDIAQVQKFFELMVHDREKLFNNDTDLFMDKTAFHVLIDAHLRSGKERQAREILENFFQTKKNNFDKNLMKPSVSHYNLFLIHYARSLMQSELEEILTMMEQDGTQPDANSAFSVVACAAKRNSEQGVEEFKRWFNSPMGLSKTPRPKRFPTTSRVYELLVITLIKEKKFDLLEDVVQTYDKDTCRRSGSTYRKVLFAYLNNSKLDDAIRVFRTYFISPASHAKAGFKADLQMCNTLLWNIYNQKDTKEHTEIIRALRFVRDKLQQKTPQEMKQERDERQRAVHEEQKKVDDGYLA